MSEHHNICTQIFENLIKLNPNNIKSYFGLFKLDESSFSNTRYDYLKSLDKKNNLSLEDKSLNNFNFSRFEKNNKDIVKEIYYLEKAHEYWVNFRKKNNLKSFTFYEKILINNFNKKNFAIKINNSSLINNNQHIFIIGLPRSGSTLVEALLLQKKKNIYSYGETSIFDFSVFNRLGNSIDTYYNFEIFGFKFLFNRIFRHAKYT